MLKAIFFKKKKFWDIVCLLCGLSLIGLFVFIGYKDSEATTGGILIGVIMGTFFSTIGIIFLLFNFRAYLYIENGHIKGKYHYFGKIDCNVTDVDFVLPQVNTLTILLKNGKRHTISGVGNTWELSSEIRRQIFKLEPEIPDGTYLELKNVQAARKKDVHLVFGGVALMFINIFITVLLTGSREMSDFSKLDWSLFAVMGVIEVLTIITMSYFAGKSSKRLFPIEHLIYRLKGANVASQPLPSGNVIRVYTDENYNGRIVVYGFPNDGGVYYCVQEFLGDDFRLDTVHTSEIYENEEALAEKTDFHSLIDIMEHFQ